MAKQGAGELPKYQRIAAELRAAIESGQYGPGDQLPGENQLKETHQVALMTARQALDVLKNEGIAESRKGKGVFVRAFRPVRRRGVQRLSQEVWGSGRSVWADDAADRDLVVDGIEVGEAPATEPVARVLGLEPGAAVCTRHRRFVLDGKPVLLSVSHLPAELVAGSPVTQEDTGPGGTYARLAELGHKPVRFREEVRSRMPSAAETRQLELSAGTPVMRICRTAFDGDGRAVELNEMTLDAAAYVLEYDIEA
ncbi:GntR family transcriptional regulator [Streptomyces armeniacus]|uniref:GntR family transcriptional regulator n=1 Tax=Streptomyces armeniacus TaxID=83291 RepID=A0A345XTH4_9ACTN|nr:GntR family transcriptional regulator [Streptomyces armeniacus]AXK34940.1 GntR family transcriptional regulator [Streptomyces armeniacus]